MLALRTVTYCTENEETPYRGKTNSPAYVPWVAKQVAELKDLSVEAVAEATTANFLSLFDRVSAS